jgi:biopolymer transport protein ExbB
MTDLVGMFQDGGFFMWPILVCAVFSSAICLERVWFLYLRASVNAPAFMSQMQKLVLADNLDRAIKICNAEPNAMLPRVFKAALLRANEAEGDIASAVEEATLEVGPLVHRRTGHLGMLANVATLLGLLGTIQGLIQAFDAVANASAEAKSALLASGIAVAMYTTFAGLVVAIPTLVLQSVILARTVQILDEVDELGLKLVNLLAARRRGRLGG